MNREDFYELEKQADGVAILWMNQRNEKINKISPELITLFDDIMDDIQNDPTIKAVVLASKKKDFITGADIESFQKVKKKGDFEPVTRKGHEILNRIEKSKKPIVAAINGGCLGAGLEIALACHARVVSDDKSTKLALPEIKLGLLPGGGGTQRLPKLVGLQVALDMMLTGKNIYADKAIKIGLADRKSHKSSLVKSTCLLALDMTKNPLKRADKRTLKDKLLEDYGYIIIFDQARKQVKKMTQGNYPAPEKIIDCVEAGWKHGMEKGLDTEAVKFEELILSPQSRELINIFFAMTEKKKNPYKEEDIRPIDHIAMVGAGFMGAGITEVSITNGYDVILKDIKREMIDSAYQTIYKNFEKQLRKKAITSVELTGYLSKITPRITYEGFQHADLVIEAVFEDLGIKHKVIQEIEKHTRPDCIFATNTSALPIAEIAKGSKNPELVIGMHYFSPVPKMPLLEIIKTEKTADWVVATCYEVGKRQGKTCIVVNDGPGFYTTRILAPMMNEALILLDEGADIIQLDTVMNQFGYPVGPVTLMDEVGIDVGAHIMSGGLMLQALEASGRKVPISSSLIKIAEAGYKGRKNKKGFYKYDEAGKKQKAVDDKIYDFFGGKTRKKMDVEEMQLRCALMMVNEAAYCLQENIIESPLDGDIGAIFGLGFPPFRGGPFRYIDFTGAAKVAQMMDKLALTHGDRFKPASIITEYAKTGKKFY